MAHGPKLIHLTGGIATVIASYLARARGSSEPEASEARIKDLNQFRRECDCFLLDYGKLDVSHHEHDDKLTALRNRFEQLLGNHTQE